MLAFVWSVEIPNSIGESGKPILQESNRKLIRLLHEVWYFIALRTFGVRGFIALASNCCGEIVGTSGLLGNKNSSSKQGGFRIGKPVRRSLGETREFVIMPACSNPNLVADLKCSMETCVGASSGTASLLQLDGPGGVMDDPVSAGRGRQTSSATGCRCQCIQPMPVFRDDLRICVDDLQGE